jgi:serine phosphatase RsbU (regulator of sigma subunit)/predicted enzyme related to lactoylglutathione lyase
MSEFDAAHPDPFLGLHAVNVYVHDQDRSIRFFVDQLGFDVAFDAQFQTGDRWVAVTPPDGTAVLGLVKPDPDSREYKLIGRSTGIVFVTEDVLAKYEAWRRRGVKFSFTPRLRRVKYKIQRPTEDPGPSAPSAGDPVWGGIFTRFKDVDGNSYGLAGFDAFNREMETRRRHIAEKLEKERRAQQELAIAQQVQARLFPQRLPHMQTLDYAGACVQARQVGGDYYDVLDLGHGRFGLVIADISGKGMAAALLMANLQANLRSQSARATDCPQTFLRSVNQLLFENTHESSYATLFFAEYDEAERRLRYANCGHLPALLLRQDGGVEHLDSTATVMGLFREWDCEIAERHLAAGDTLALYTDGITESFDNAGEEFGEHRLIEALARTRHLTPQARIASVVDEVRGFSPGEQHDDITLIVAACRCAG